jgi:hypothetical protein
MGGTAERGEQAAGHLHVMTFNILKQQSRSLLVAGLSNVCRNLVSSFDLLLDSHQVPHLAQVVEKLSHVRKRRSHSILLSKSL